MKELKVRLMERSLGAELTEHLGYEPDTQANQPTEQPPQLAVAARTLKGN